jgi:hypothetical protein
MRHKQAGIALDSSVRLDLRFANFSTQCNGSCSGFALNPPLTMGLFGYR